jgi:hypothetical protein
LGEADGEVPTLLVRGLVVDHARAVLRGMGPTSRGRRLLLVVRLALPVPRVVRPVVVLTRLPTTTVFLAVVWLEVVRHLRVGMGHLRPMMLRTHRRVVQKLVHVVVVMETVAAHDHLPPDDG